MRVVLDTNVLLVSISRKSRHHWVFSELLDGAYTLCASNDILLEYEEVLARKWNAEVSRNTLRTLLLLPNFERIEVYYRWQLLEQDPDDNKFIDCAIAANVDWLVTEDKHFLPLLQIPFPPLQLAGMDTFRSLLFSE